MSCVITHPEHGIYLGSCMGLGFWSMLDAVGQESACTFPDRDEALAHIQSWENNNDPAQYATVDVLTCGAEGFATIADLRSAGLDNMLGEMADPPAVAAKLRANPVPLTLVRKASESSGPCL